MASASSPPSHRSNTTLPSRSYIQKSVCLQDWWLIKPQTHDHKNTLGVAGLTFTSQENRAERCFTSAPILKVYDFFELETVDGVCIVLQGLINRDRTLESGFSSEVFSHFIIGFPPYWEEYATSCPERGSSADCVSGANTNLAHEDGKDSTEGHQDIHDKALGKSRHSDILDIGVQDCEDTDLSNKTSTNCNESSLEVPHEHIIKAGHEVLCERSPLKSAFEDNPSLMGSPMTTDVQSKKHDVIRNFPLSKNFKVDAVDSSTISKCLKVSSWRMTRSTKKMDNSKNHSAQGSLLHNTSNLDKLVDKKDDLSDKMAVDVVDCDETYLLHVGASSFPSAAAEVADKYSSLGDKFDTVELPVISGQDTVAQRSVRSSLEHSENCDLQNFRSCQRGISSSSCGAKCKSRKSVSKSERNPDEQNLKNLSSTLSVGYGKGSHKAASCFEGVVLRSKSKGKQDGQYVIDVMEDQRSKSTFQFGTFNQKKNNDTGVSSESEINMRSDFGAKRLLDLFEAACSEPLDPLSTTVDDECVVNVSTANFNFASSVKDINEDEVLSRTNMKACRSKKRTIAAKCESRVDVADKDVNATVAKQGIASKEASMTGSKSKRKLTFGSSQREMAKKQCITSPKSAKSTSRLGVLHPTGTTAEKEDSEERYGNANILSPESFSGKRSRSGRLLLPTLEYWRNQTVVYDADRQVTGVREGTYVAPSPGDISQDNKTFKKTGRRASKP